MAAARTPCPALRDFLEARGELGVAVHQQILLVLEQPIVEGREVLGRLPHPRRIRVRRAASELNAPRFQFHHEQQIKRHQPAR
ncbi:MAG TPA: hypothetical protein VFI31_04610, partial [Pirellulales bacterium]|nr:hypothetical protein [Pirellulales bacterium]